MNYTTFQTPKFCQRLPLYFSGICFAALFIAIVPDVNAQATSVNNVGNSINVISDVLIVLDSDGRSHTVQHTVATTGPRMKVHLPGSVIPHEVQFFGPDRERFTTQYQADPSALDIVSGSAFARYQHQYGLEVQQLQPGLYVLTTPSIPANIEVVESSLTQSSISWVLPSEFEIVSYSATDRGTGRWVMVNNTLTFHHAKGVAVPLVINYRKLSNALSLEVPACNAANLSSDECAEDKDEDGIPDYRDVCRSSLGQDTNVFGCADTQTMVLDRIEFATGRTYLDVRARKLLDKVAHAILKSKHTFYEVNAHTDNMGAALSNKQLSRKRAEAVRHYLMLKGVNPNSLRASGYGEQYPVRDNSTSDGRRANRRIELVVIQ